jgi:small-conductance mechanosensitive channel
MIAQYSPKLLQDLLSKIPLSPWVVGPIIALLWLAILLPAKKLLLARTHHYLARRTHWAWADSLIEALGPTITIIVIAGAIALLSWILPLNSRAERALYVMLVGAVVLALMVFADRICRGLLERMASHSVALQGELGLIRGATRGVVIALAMMVFLDSVGISITPLIASLGIGTAAIALALQDTLTNLFAGIYMMAEKPIEAGHFIQLESSEQGHVEHVGWRSTQIRTLGDIVVVVPNSKLAGSVITNFSLPRNELGITVEVGVDYSSDLEKVEAITLEVARQVIDRVTGAASEFEPHVRFHSFADSSINFKVWLGARNYIEGLTLKHEFIKCLHSRYKQEGIIIPSPIRTIDMPDKLLLKLRECFREEVTLSNNSSNWIATRGTLPKDQGK